MPNFDKAYIRCVFLFYQYPLYFLRVASPPRMWRSLLLVLSTFFTSSKSCGSLYRNRSDTSLCTVDLLTLKTFAAKRTVAPVLAIYSPKITDRSLVKSLTHNQLHTRLVNYMLMRFFLLLKAIGKNSTLYYRQIFITVFTVFFTVKVVITSKGF